MLTLKLSKPTAASAATATGLEPFELILILPLSVCFLISIMASLMVSHINKGSPSQPWPKLTIGYGAYIKCGTVYSTTSAAEGLNDKRSWFETISSSIGWKEIQPMQFALQAGEIGMGHSHLPIAKFLAAGQ